MIFFSEFHWHDLGFLGKILIFLDILARLIAKILAKNLKNLRSWQQMKKIQDHGKKFKTPSTGWPVVFLSYLVNYYTFLETTSGSSQADSTTPLISTIATSSWTSAETTQPPTPNGCRNFQKLAKSSPGLSLWDKHSWTALFQRFDVLQRRLRQHEKHQR